MISHFKNILLVLLCLAACSPRAPEKPFTSSAEWVVINSPGGLYSLERPPDWTESVSTGQGPSGKDSVVIIQKAAAGLIIETFNGLDPLEGSPNLILKKFAERSSPRSDVFRVAGANWAGVGQELAFCDGSQLIVVTRVRNVLIKFEANSCGKDLSEKRDALAKMIKSFKIKDESKGS